ncbi:hypothetical protein CYMTET_12192, partial [Cymbomonas tetramitiformis]
MSCEHTPKTLQVSAGGEHSLVLLASGHVKSFGACGLGWSRLCSDDSVLSGLYKCKSAGLEKKAVQIAAGAYHNVAVTEGGQVLTWGCGVFTDGNSDGAIPALGMPRSTTVENTEPRALPAHPVLSAGVRTAAAGGYHTVLLTRDSPARVLTFGAAQLGQLGRQPQ